MKVNTFQYFLDSLIGFFTFYGGGDSGGSSAPQESTSYSTNLPPYAKPYFKEMMARTQRESLRPYEAYEGPRIAGFSGAQEQAQQGILGMQASPGMQQGQDLVAQAGQQASQTGSYTPTQFNNSFQAQDVDGGTFDSAAAQQYMSPYMQNVVDIQKREIGRQGDISRQGIAAEAQQAGAFGGSRHGVQEAELDRNLMQQMSDVQAQGQQQAYENAQTMFGEDRAARLQAQQQEQAAQQAQAELGMNEQQMTEAAQQFGANYEQQQQGLMAEIGQSQAAMADAEQAYNMARLEAQNAVGAEQQQMAQQVLDQKYEQFLNARDNERQNLAFYNALMRGIPVPTQGEVIQYQPGASTGSQLMGAGIAGLGAYLGQGNGG